LGPCGRVRLAELAEQGDGGGVHRARPSGENLTWIVETAGDGQSSGKFAFFAVARISMVNHFDYPETFRVRCQYHNQRTSPHRNLPMWIRKCDLDAQAEAPSPIPTQLVSNEEFIPVPQTPQQKA